MEFVEQRKTIDRKYSIVVFNVPQYCKTVFSIFPSSRPTSHLRCGQVEVRGITIDRKCTVFVRTNGTHLYIWHKRNAAKMVCTHHQKGRLFYSVKWTRRPKRNKQMLYGATGTRVWQRQFEHHKVEEVAELYWTLRHSRSRRISACSVSQKIVLLQLIWHNFNNLQHLLTIFGTDRPYSILNWLH